MNGAPIPDAPRNDDCLFAVFLIGIVCMVALIFLGIALEHRDLKRRNEQEVLADQIAREKQEVEDFRIQTLINQSPGGRKPWQ